MHVYDTLWYEIIILVYFDTPCPSENDNKRMSISLIFQYLKCDWGFDPKYAMLPILPPHKKLPLIANLGLQTPITANCDPKSR